MPVRPEFAARLSKFMQTYGHHYAPSQPSQPAPEAAQAVAPKPDAGQRPNPEPKVDRNVGTYINDARARLGLPPIGPGQALGLTPPSPKPTPPPMAPSAQSFTPSPTQGPPPVLASAAAPAPKPMAEPSKPAEVPHHSEYQPRDAGQFSGPPIPKWYKMKEGNE